MLFKSASLLKNSGSFALLLLATSVGATQTSFVATGAEKPEFSTKEVMEESMKKGLWKKVVAGEASAEEKKHLVELFAALSENAPPKGSAESWGEKTTALLAAAKGVAAGEEGAAEQLKTAINCGSCHKAHK